MVGQANYHILKHYKTPRINSNTYNLSIGWEQTDQLLKMKKHWKERYNVSVRDKWGSSNQWRSTWHRNNWISKLKIDKNHKPFLTVHTTINLQWARDLKLSCNYSSITEKVVWFLYILRDKKFPMPKISKAFMKKINILIM